MYYILKTIWQRNKNCIKILNWKKKVENVKCLLINAYLVVKFMSVELLCVNCLIFQYQFAVQNVVILKK